MKNFLQYAVIREIGRGAKGVVYLVEKDGARYALKTLLREEGPGHLDSVLRFRQEMMALSSLQHPGIVRVIEAGEHEGEHFTVMEFLDGRNLQSLLQEGPLEEKKALDIALQLASALQEIHRQKLIHRDVKPENVVLAAEGVVKLVDFGMVTGIARNPLAKGTEPVVGTLAYSSPEQSGLTSNAVTECTDLYSLGVVMYEMLIGSNPFQGIEQGRVLQQKTQSSNVNLSTLNPKIPFVLGQIVAKLMEPDPALRYQSARGLIADLKNLPNLEESRRNGTSYVLGTQDRALRLQEGPLVGRRHELEILKEVWSKTKAHAGGMVFVEGEAGVGKTRLAHEILDIARADKGEALSSRCSQMGAAALAPVLEILKLYFNEVLLLAAEEQALVVQSLKSLPIPTLQTLAGMAEEVASLLGMGADRGRAAPLTQEVLNQHLVQVFQWLGDRKTGLVVVLEDVHWMDEPSVEFLKRLAREVHQFSVMIVATGRATGKIRGIEWHDLKLNPLTPAEARDLISNWLGGLPVDPKMVEKITGPTNFNAMSMREYLSGMIEAGILTVEEGQVLLDEARLAEVGLSADAARLIQARVKKLPPSSRQILRMAAVLGLRFSKSELALVLNESAVSVSVALPPAQRDNLIEVAGPDEFAFTHEKVKDAFLSLFTESELREAHDQAAEHLQAIEKKSPAQIHALALHYRNGSPDRNVAKALVALADAGQLSIDNYSHQMAYDILKYAYDLIGRENLPSESTFRTLELFGVACHNTSRYEIATEVFDQLLSITPDALTQGRIWYWKVRISNGSGRLDEGWQNFLAGMKVLGERYYDNILFKVLGLIYFLILNYLWLSLDGGRGVDAPSDLSKKAEERRQKRALVGKLFAVAINNCFIRLQLIDMAHLVFRASASVYKMGRRTEAVTALAQAASASSTIGLKRFSAMAFKAAYATARKLGDQSAEIFVDFHFLLSLLFLSKFKEYDEFFPAFLARAEKFLPYWDLGSIFVSHAAILSQKGLFKEAADFHFKKMYLIDETRNLGLMADFRQSYAARLEFLGRTKEAANIRAESERYFEQINNGNLMTRSVKTAFMMFLAAEGEGASESVTDEVIAKFLAGNPKGYFMVYPFIWVAQVRLVQYETALTPESRATRLAQFGVALKDLKKRAKSDLVVAMVKMIDAAAARIDRDFERAEANIEEGERLAEKCGSVNALYLGFVERARLAREKGAPRRMVMEAKAAYDYAKVRDWAVRVRQLEREFGPLAAVVVKSTAPKKALVSGLDRERAMNALLEISAAASRSIDPLEQSRATLDTVVQLLGAERACIFLGTESASLKYFLGRTAKAEDILEIKGFSTTVVRKVFEERKPVIITGTEQGEAIGSKSIVAHNLKSIMVVPLVLSQDIKGVIYLDSSITKSLFSEADLDLFVAISTQIASSIHFSELAAIENERQMMKKDLELSVSVQKLFLPPITDCDFTGVSLSAFYRPAAQCGGDWWWYKVHGGKLYIMVGDVGGHGVGPAMITASVASAYKIWEKVPETNIGELIQSTNRHLFEIAQGEHYMTMFGCEIDLQSKMIRFWSAGAPPVLVQNRQEPGSSFVGEAGGLLGAAAEDLVLGVGDYQAKSGDRLFIYSDGISEMCDQRGRALGFRRMGSLLEQLKVHDVHQLKGSLIERLDEMRGTTPQDDDFTFVIVDII